MSNVPLSYLPGVCKVDSAYTDSLKSSYVNGRAATGRFTDMQWMRFNAGLPEKIVPFHYFGLYNNSPSIPRKLKDWRDNNSNVYLGVGAADSLNVITSTFIGGTFALLTNTDITPLRYITTGTLTNPFTTTNSSSTFTVTSTANNLALNDWVQLVGTTAVAGVTIANSYSVNGTGANTFNFNAVGTANATQTAVGGVVTYGFPHAQLTNPFITTLGTNLVTVLHTAHGAGQGDKIYWTGGTNFAGLTLSAGTTTINSILGTNSYNIFANGTGATANGTGGGSPIFSYGITFQSLSNFKSPGMWQASPYGQQLLASVPGASVYVYDPIIGGRAYPLYGAPASGVFGMFVTPERFVFILGNASASNPNLTVLWPDQSNYNTFTSTPANTANSGRTLQEGSYLVGGVSVRDGLSLVFTNTAVYQFQYTGDNNVYSSTLSGKNCGLIGPAAVAVMNNIAYWFSGGDFWIWNGQVQKIQSDDIRDYVVQDLDRANAYKCSVGTNIKRSEVWFLYPSVTDNTGENTRYIIYHADQGCFSSGLTDAVDLTPIKFFSAIDETPLFYNSMVADSFLGIGVMDDNVNLYSSNTFYNNASITFSPIDISKGDRNMDIFSVIPDLRSMLGNASTGDVDIYINIKDYPHNTEIANGPYLIDSGTPRVDFRLSGKLVGFKIQDDLPRSLALWRLGTPRIEIQPSGARR